MNVILSQPTSVLVVALLVFVVLSTVAALILLAVLSRWITHAGPVVPVPPFVAVVAACWALALGFAASDIWLLGAQADKAAAAERSSVMRILGVSAPEALDMPQMHEAIGEYARLVGTTEWGENRNGWANPEVDEELQTIRLAIIDMARSDVPQALVSKVVQDFDELQDARNERLAIGQSLVDEAKWYLVIALTALTMVTIVAVHLERPRAAINALVIFAVVAFISLWVLALHIHPYAQRQAVLASIAMES